MPDLNRLHPILLHFPIALFTTSLFVDLLAFRWPSLRQFGWVALLLAALAAVPTVVTGIIAHFPYEDSPQISSITQHEQLGLLTLAFLVALTLWRGLSLRRKIELGGRWYYLAIGFVAFGLLYLVGTTGGNLVYNLGVGVSGK